MAKVICKGTALKQEIASVYTTVAQVISLDVTGEKPVTYDSTTLDGSAYKTKAWTGYVDPPTISGEMFYDPALSGHQSFVALMASGTVTNFRITYVDGSTTSHTYSVVSVGVDKKVAIDDGLKASFSLETSGAPS